MTLNTLRLQPELPTAGHKIVLVGMADLWDYFTFHKGTMSTIATSGPSLASGSRPRLNLAFKVLAWIAILALAVGFVLKYVFRYYLNYNEAAFTDPALGSPNYWSQRGWLLMHITGGMVALLSGPWQFWTGFRMRYARLHRWTGRLFLCGVAVGSAGAYHMAIVTSYGWAFGFSLLGLATAWVTTAGMAYYAILKRRISVHKEWMVRAYVVTFAFVTFRILSDYGPTSRLQPENDKSITIGWACWALPLLLTEVILQLRSMRSSSAPS
jgi:heme/copper-type cytochrome/quinol oxidase subunit 3